MTDASTVPGIVTCWRTIDATLDAVMPVGAVEALERPASQPNRAQSWPEAATLSGRVGVGWTEFLPHDDSAAKPIIAAAVQHMFEERRCIGTQGFESSGVGRTEIDTRASAASDELTG